MSTRGTIQRVGLGRSVTTPGDARRTIHEWLSDLGMSGDQLSDIVLAASELVTNTVIHAQTACEVILRIHGDRLRFEVHDEAPRPPETRVPEPGTGGLGLHIVERVADDWGWQPTASGKYVWFEIKRSRR